MDKSSDLGDIEESKFICDICDHVLIDTVESSCRHTFCTYCLYMWKKHDALCPICGHDLGKILRRHDIDEFIIDFFSTANPLAQSERNFFIETRQRTNKIADLPKVLFKTNNLSNFGKLNEDGVGVGTAPRLKTPTSASRFVQKRNSIKRDNLLKLNKETYKLEKELQGTYSRIFNLGDNISMEENILAPQFFDPNPCNGPMCTKNLRPSTVGSNLGVSKLLPRFHDKIEVDELLEQTNEMIKIEKFLKKYSFDNIKVMDETSSSSSNFKSEYPESINKEALKELNEMNLGIDENGSNDHKIKKGIIKPKSLHPSIQDFFKKQKIQTKIPIHIPKKRSGEGKGDHLVDSSCHSTRPNTSMCKDVNYDNDESVCELHKCREALLKIRERYENYNENTVKLSGPSNSNERLKNNLLHKTSGGKKTSTKFSLKAKDVITHNNTNIDSGGEGDAKLKTSSTCTLKQTKPENFDKDKFKKTGSSGIGRNTFRNIPPASARVKSNEKNDLKKKWNT